TKCVYFFFQAEDGIRDYKVTGVQTCALPIYSNQKVEELQKQLDELRKQMSKLEAQLGELRSKATEAAAPTAAPPAAQEGTIQATLPPAQAAPSKQVGEATATYTTFSEDSVAAARFNNAPLDPKYHGFFRL